MATLDNGTTKRAWQAAMRRRGRMPPITQRDLINPATQMRRYVDWALANGKRVVYAWRGDYELQSYLRQRDIDLEVEYVDPAEYK